LQQSINTVFENIFNILISFLEGFVHDPGTRWGLAIIVFTVLFNLLVLPLNWRAMQNSKKMGEVQPEIKKLQEKYKNEPQKFAEEQQKLMKENNVSMLGGCLPLLVTWPLFIAMFNVFRNLSAPGGPIVGRSFTPLIPDLSKANNIPLTVFVVIATIFQQWTMARGNRFKSAEVKAQQSQMQSMNVVTAAMMAWFSWTQPAALGLYWVAGTIFRAGQQLVMNKLEEDDMRKKGLIDENNQRVVKDAVIVEEKKNVRTRRKK